jgi:phage protein D
MKGITPTYKIINADSGKDLTASIKPFIKSLSLTESSESTNDTLSISMDGTGIIAFPPSGTNIEVHLGYEETGLANFGVYKVDGKTLTGLPLTLSIQAGASDFNAPYKAQKSRNWDDQTLGDILKNIAAENSLTLVIDDALASIQITYLAQQQESDMNLIARLAKEHSADGTIKSGKLVFKEKSKPARVRKITPSELTRFRVNWTDKPVFGCAVATWHDLNSNIAHQEIYSGEEFTDTIIGNPTRVKAVSSSQFEARKLAKEHWHKLGEMQLSGNFSMVGDIDIISKMGLELTAFIKETEGIVLLVKKVSHTINQQGYQTNIEATNQV